MTALRAALAPLLITAFMASGVALLWPDGGSPTFDRAGRMCREAVTDRLTAPIGARFGDNRYTRNGGAVEVTGTVDAANRAGARVPVSFTCTARGRYATEMRLDTVDVTGR